jgi:hypothetical protein
MSEGETPGVLLTVEVCCDDEELWRWSVAERLGEEGEGPGFTLWGDRWLAGGAVSTLDRAQSSELRLPTVLLRYAAAPRNCWNPSSTRSLLALRRRSTQ